jgi:hypothetical protein
VYRTNHNSREQTLSIIYLCFPQAFIKLHVMLETKVGMAWSKLDGFSYVPTMLPKSIANTRWWCPISFARFFTKLSQS